MKGEAGTISPPAKASQLGGIPCWLLYPLLPAGALFLHHLLVLLLLRVVQDCFNAMIRILTNFAHFRHSVTRRKRIIGAQRSKLLQAICENRLKRRLLVRRQTQLLCHLSGLAPWVWNVTRPRIYRTTLRGRLPRVCFWYLALLLSQGKCTR